MGGPGSGRYPAGSGNKKEPSGDQRTSKSSYNKQERIGFVMEDVPGMSKEQATEVVDSFSSYTSAVNNNYSNIRKASIGKNYNKDMVKKANAIDNYIENAPKFKGEVYRGMDIDNASYFKAGDKLDMKGMSSWTSDKSIGKEFTDSKSNKDRCLFRIKNSSKGTSISHLSNATREKEVMFSSKQKFKITNVTKSNGLYNIDVEELD